MQSTGDYYCMDNRLNIDNMDMIRTLSFLHEGLEVVHERVVTYVEDGKRYVCDLNDEPIIVDDENKLFLVGTFAVNTSSDFRNAYTKSDMTIISTITGMKSQFKDCYNTEEMVNYLGTHFIGRCSYDKRYNRVISIYNIYMQEVYQVKEARVLKCLEDTPVSTRIGQLINGSWHIIMASKASNNIEIFDSYELDSVNRVSLMGKAWDANRGLSISRHNISNVRYMLCKDYTCKGKLYMDITKPAELSNTTYLMTHDFDDIYKKDRICKGIIEETEGKEIFKTLYDDISYIGSDNFILDFFDTRQIVSAKTGIIIDSVAKNQIYIHPTLPMVIIVNNGEYMILDTKGRLFNLRDIAKYFDCYYTLKDAEILKIKLEYKIVYVTNRLVPITNIHNIGVISTYDWVKL